MKDVLIPVSVRELIALKNAHKLVGAMNKKGWNVIRVFEEEDESISLLPTHDIRDTLGQLIAKVEKSHVVLQAEKSATELGLSRAEVLDMCFKGVCALKTLGLVESEFVDSFRSFINDLKKFPVVDTESARVWTESEYKDLQDKLSKKIELDYFRDQGVAPGKERVGFTRAILIAKGLIKDSWERVGDIAGGIENDR